MDLEKVTAKIRPRRQWEAIDLGVALGQRHLLTLFKIWFLTTLPIFLLASLVFHESSIWVILVFWLLLPFWERPLLHFLSRELFGERLTVKECVLAFFSLAKIQWFASISWRRLSFTRSLDLPVIQLEGLSGRARSNRLKVIHSFGSGSAVWLTFLFLLTESVMYVGILVLAYLLLPEPVAAEIDLSEWIFNQGDSDLSTFILNTITYLAISFVTPFYVACGFTTYINQRTHLEAWDIELAFKRLAQRLVDKEKAQTVRLANWFGAIILISWLAIPSYSVQAEEKVFIEKESSSEMIIVNRESEASESLNSLQAENNPSKLDGLRQRAREEISAIRSGEEFKKTVTDYRYVKRSDDDSEQTTEPSSSSGIWHLLGKIISFLVEFALWIFVALAVIFLASKYRYFLKAFGGVEISKSKKPQTLFGLDVTAENLPKNAWQIAEKLIHEGNVRDGLSLLYRASLVWFIENTGVVISEGDTELECLRKLTPFVSREQKIFMQSLTTNWRQIAYAHAVLDNEKLLSLCAKWCKVFILPNSNSEKTIANERTV